MIIPKVIASLLQLLVEFSANLKMIHSSNSDVYLDISFSSLFCLFVFSYIHFDLVLINLSTVTTSLCFDCFHVLFIPHWLSQSFIFLNECLS